MIRARTIATPVAALLPVLVAPAADAALQLVSQTRAVSVEAVHREDVYASCIPLLDPFCQPDSSTTTISGDDASAPDAGPWSASVTVSGGTAASQDSSLGAFAIHASGSHAGASLYTNSGGFPITFVSEDHTSASDFSATFELLQPETFHLTGNVVTEGGLLSGSQAFVRLVGPGAAIVAEVTVESDPDCVDPACATVGPEPIDVSGALAPGTYTLEASASGTASGTHSTSGSFGSADAGAFALAFQLTSAPTVPMLPPWIVALLGAGFAASARLALRRLDAGGARDGERGARRTG